MIRRVYPNHILSPVRYGPLFCDTFLRVGFDSVVEWLFFSEIVQPNNQTTEPNVGFTTKTITQSHYQNQHERNGQKKIRLFDWASGIPYML